MNGQETFGSLRTLFCAAVTSPASEMLPDDLEITSPEQPLTGPTQSFKQAKKKVVDEFERTYVSQMLAAFGGNISRAAKAARKNRRAFWEIMKKHRIRAQDFLTEEPKLRHPDQRTAFPPG